MIRWIAEIGSNHRQDINHCFELITQAKEIGCWAAKFQLFKGNRLYHSSFTKQIEKMKNWELPEIFIPEIANFCKMLEINFICTPFDLDTVQALKPYVDYFKIGSYENQWHDLIMAVAKTGKPWMISVGMENFKLGTTIYYSFLNPFKYCSDNFLKNIRSAEKLGRNNDNSLYAILACNSNYPAKPENCSLQNVKKLKNYFRFQKIGWSDHTTEPGVIYKAIALGAEYIEFHFGDGPEAAIGHCWKYDDIARVIRDVKIGEIAEQNNDTEEDEAKKWQTDPIDGLRPLREYRKELLG
ncbi:MAG: N-acetylneuraminate synthase family protein [Gammaproteobacteria bacterium]|nr:N-acetylneuraminate synthase family protein [Gammaproteobacteria bacterium]MBU2685617.1 N-acetylneuraminate synthase family protein [Gammaproteobacteria bacterium]